MGEVLTHANFSAKWFSPRQLACKHCGVVRVDRDLIAALEALGELVQSKINIVCGYRCPTRNAMRAAESSAVAKVSQHMFGKAADITVVGMGLVKLASQAEKVPAFRDGGMSLYEGEFVHVDVRGYRARW